MKYVCSFPCQVGRHIYKPGDTADFDDAALAASPQIRGSFAPAEDAAAPAEDAAARDTEEPDLTKSELMDRLDRLGVPYNPRDKRETLLSKWREAVDAKPNNVI